MFGSPPLDSHRLRNRDIRGSPLATHYRSTQEQSIITVRVSSAHARKDVISFFLCPGKSGNVKSVRYVVGFSDFVGQWVVLYITNKIYVVGFSDFQGHWVVLYNQQNICSGFESPRFHIICAFFREKKK